MGKIFFLLDKKFDSLERTISVSQLYRLIKKRIWLIVVVVMMIVGLSGAWRFFFLTPQYQAVTKFVFFSYGSLGWGSNFRDALRSPEVLDQVIDKVGLKQSRRQLQENMFIATVSDSQLLMKVNDEDPDRAREISDAVMVVFNEETIKAEDAESFPILSTREIPASLDPVNNNTPTNWMISFVLTYSWF